MQPDQRSFATTTDIAFATVLPLARTRRMMRYAVAYLHEAQAAHASILEVRRRSAEMHAGAVEASQRRIEASRELLRRLGQQDGPAHRPLDPGQGST
jgi:hypothetical protein